MDRPRRQVDPLAHERTTPSSDYDAPVRAAVAVVISLLAGCGARTSLDQGAGIGGSTGSDGAAAITVGIGPGGVTTGIASSGGGGATAGSGGAAPAVTCDPGEPMIDLAAIAWPSGAAHDEANLYVASYTEEGGVWRVPKDGAEPSLLASVSYGSGVAVAGGWVYVAASGDRRVIRVPVAGGDVEALADFFGPSDVAVAGDALLVANYLDDEVARIPLGGGRPLVLASGESGVYRLAVGDGLVAWGGFTEELRAVAVDGGAVTTLAPYDARRIAFRGGAFWFTSNGPSGAPRRIVRAEAGGASTVVVEDTSLFLEGIDVDDRHVYFARWSEGAQSLGRVPLEGGLVEEVVRIDQPLEVIVDGSCLYVTGGTSEDRPGRVVRLGLPATL